MYTDDLAEWFDTSNYYNVPELNYVYNDTVPKGVIVSQDPAPKEVRKVLAGKQKCSISFEISLGVREMILEDYTVQDYRVVDQAIRKLGLKVKIIHVSSDTHEIGFVIKTEPAAGTVVQDNDTITVYVSKGTDTVKTTVPDFTGLNEAQVLLQLMEANLHVGKVTYVRDDGVPGLVLSQSIDAWYEVPIYTSVDFTISGGPSYSGDGSTVPTPEDLEESKPEVNYPPYNPTYPDDDEDDDDNDNWFVDNEPEETQSSWKDFYDWWMGRQ